MALQTRFESLDLSTLTQLPQLARQELTERRDALVQRAALERARLTQRQQRLTGKLIDDSERRACTVAQRSLQRAGELLEHAPLARVKTAASKLQQRAEGLQQRVAAIDVPAIPDYDKLNVSQVNAYLAEMDAHQLEKVRAYESANKDRVTVLREIDRLLV